MQGIRHPFTRALYEKDEDDLVRITERDGRIGVYRADGSWVSGDRIDADIHLCGWVAGPRASHRLSTPSGS